MNSLQGGLEPVGTWRAGSRGSSGMLPPCVDLGIELVSTAAQRPPRVLSGGFGCGQHRGVLGGGRKIPAAVTGGLVCLGLRLVWEPLGAASRGTRGTRL